MTQPLVSIITVTFNNIEGLKRTCASCKKLQGNLHEHIIIDGGSKDGSAAFLSQTLPLVPNVYWSSESDNGIYDAMNKGISKAKGQWVIFMNAGDTFFSSEVLQAIDFPTGPAVLYGNCEIQYDSNYKRKMAPTQLKHFWKGLPFSHQAVLMHHSLIKSGFNLSFTYCADFYLLFKTYLSNNTFTSTNQTIAVICAGGVSDNQRYAATAEVYEINRQIKPSVKSHFYFIPKIIGSFVVVKLKALLPKKVLNIFYKLKYK